ncbi:MAG: lysozyme inhibitor LprI family protein [Gallionellaceae bacterium]
MKMTYDSKNKVMLRLLPGGNFYKKGSGMIKLALIGLGWVVLGMNAQGASFDCGKAQSKVEHLICDNAEISKLDEELAAAYKAALQVKGKSDEVKNIQLNWLKVRNRCLSKDCINQEYTRQINVLQGQLNGFSVTSIKQRVSYIYEIEGEGKGQSLCEAILVELNKKEVTEEYRPCLSKVILGLPGVKDPELWEKLDFEKHVDLIKKLYVLNSVGSTEYFNKVKVMPQHYPFADEQMKFVEVVRKKNPELYVLRKPAEWFEDRVLVTLRSRNESCGVPRNQISEYDESAWVTPDLKEIAGGYLPGTFEARAARPIVYKGRLYLSRPYAIDDALEIFKLQDSKNRFMDMVCHIRLTTNIDK